MSSSAVIFSAIVLPMPGQLLGAALARELRHRHAGLADRLRGVAVGDHPVHHRAVELVQAPELLEGVSYLAVAHPP